MSTARRTAGLMLVLIQAAPWVLPETVLVFPQLIQGSSTRTTLVLINSGSEEDAGEVQFRDSSGALMELSVDGTARSSLDYTIPPGGFQLIDLSGPGPVRTGYALVRSVREEAEISGIGRITLGEHELVFLDAPARREHSLFLEQGTSRRTGIAVVNRTGGENTLKLEAVNPSAEVVDQGEFTLEEGEQRALFPEELLQKLPPAFLGLLRVSSGSPFSLMGVRQDALGAVSPLPAPSRGTAALESPGPELFSGSLALTHLEDQLAHGPRPTGSSGLLSAGDEILGKLEAFGWKVEQDLHTVDVDALRIPVRNLVARVGRGSPVVLGAHYDTRIHADQDPDPSLRADPVPGANDGASGAAVLLELARVVAEHYVPNNEIRLLFFDAEDNGGIHPWTERPESQGGWIIGSTLYAQNLDLESDPVQFMILVDMVGDMNQRFPQELHSRTSAPDLVDEIWSIAATLGFGGVFLPQPGLTILDDHLPFIERGIPSVDIIDLDYPYWHTTEDTLDKVSAESLERVGRVLQTFLIQRGAIRRKE